MIVAGGVYLEICVSPASVSLFGPGGRAALGLADLSHRVELHAFQPAALAEDVFPNFEPFGVDVRLYPCSDRIGFKYLYPLAKPRITPVPLPKAGTITVAGQHILRFGCLEGDFRIEANCAVYDPQSAVEPARFGANGSRADKLAVVLNRAELLSSTGLDQVEDAARALLDRDGAQVVVVKSGPYGALVFEPGIAAVAVPAYQTQAIYKIGSGDVFSAAFAHYWSEARLSPAEAARLASLHAADYVETRLIPFRSPPPDRQPVSVPAKRSVAVSTASGGASAAWLRDEAMSALADLSVEAEMVEAGDIDALDQARAGGSSILFVLMQCADVNLTRLIQAALAARMSVVIYTELTHSEDEDAFARTGCRVERELTAALYQVAWA